MTPTARSALATLLLALVLSPAPVHAQDGSRDFDFNFGSWHTHLRRLRQPLSGSQDWVEYEGTSIVHRLLDGRANLVELSVSGPAGRIEGVLLRLYHPESRLWYLHYASMANGELTPPLVGAFENGRGTFYADDALDGRPIRIRFVISDITDRSARFEQAFSADGGKTWEVNWIATDRRR